MFGKIMIFFGLALVIFGIYLDLVNREDKPGMYIGIPGLILIVFGFVFWGISAFGKGAEKTIAYMQTDEFKKGVKKAKKQVKKYQKKYKDPEDLR